MNDKIDLFIIFLFFTIIIVSSVFYPIFYIENFSLLDGKYNIEGSPKIIKCLECKEHKIEKIIKDNGNLDNDNLETNKYEYKFNKDIPNEIDNENDIKDILLNTEFKAECCPSMVSSSVGCACISPNLSAYIEKRGNNKKCY